MVEGVRSGRHQTKVDPTGRRNFAGEAVATGTTRGGLTSDDVAAGRSEEYAEEVIVLAFTLSAPVNTVGIFTGGHDKGAMGIDKGNVAGAVVVG